MARNVLCLPLLKARNVLWLPLLKARDMLCLPLLKARNVLWLPLLKARNMLCLPLLKACNVLYLPLLMARNMIQWSRRSALDHLLHCDEISAKKRSVQLVVIISLCNEETISSTRGYYQPLQ